MRPVKIISLVSVLMCVSPVAFSEKPEWAGKGKPNLEEIKSSSDIEKALRSRLRTAMKNSKS